MKIICSDAEIMLKDFAKNENVGGLLLNEIASCSLPFNELFVINLRKHQPICLLPQQAAMF